jgi:GxxExxY protein
MQINTDEILDERGIVMIREQPAIEDINLLTQKIIGCAFVVSNQLGSGFLEKVYENALAHELRKAEIKVLQQVAIPVYYDGVNVGDYIADVLVEDCIIIELKTVKSLENIHVAQCLNYLKATGYKICLLLNFYRPKLEIKRIINQF